MRVETSTTAVDLAVLTDPGASLTDVKRAIRAGEAALAGAPEIRFGVSATATMDLLATMLRRHALVHGLRAVVDQGSLDAHLDNIERFATEGIEHVVLLTTVENLLPAFERAPRRSSGAFPVGAGRRARSLRWRTARCLSRWASSEPWSTTARRPCTSAWRRSIVAKQVHRRRGADAEADLGAPASAASPARIARLTSVSEAPGSVRTAGRPPWWRSRPSSHRLPAVDPQGLAGDVVGAGRAR